jgi:DNA ligase-associated metallophosphoesterase
MTRRAAQSEAAPKPTPQASIDGSVPDAPALAIASIEDAPTLAGIDIALLPGRAALLPATGTLVCADLHLGKAATFRRAGMPIPEGSAQQDLTRLTELVRRHAARRLVVVGDLFHAGKGCTTQVLDEFRHCCDELRSSGTEVVLVLGNHERSLGRHFSPRDLGIDHCVKELAEPPFRFVHEPTTDTTQPAGEPPLFTIAGHLHPTITLKSPSGDRLTGRCFVATPGLLILPAFGSFTGGHRVIPTRDMRVWLARDDGVVQICPESPRN